MPRSLSKPPGLTPRYFLKLSKYCTVLQGVQSKIMLVLFSLSKCPIQGDTAVSSRVSSQKFLGVHCPVLQSSPGCPIKNFVGIVLSLSRCPIREDDAVSSRPRYPQSGLFGLSVLCSRKNYRNQRALFLLGFSTKTAAMPYQCKPLYSTHEMSNPT